MTQYLDVTVRIPLEEIPPGFDPNNVRTMLFGYVQGVLVPVHGLKVVDPIDQPRYTMHYHKSTRRDACAGCMEIAQDGVN